MIYIRYPSSGSSILSYLELLPTPFSVTTTTASGTGPNGIPIASVETPASVPVTLPLRFRYCKDEKFLPLSTRSSLRAAIQSGCVRRRDPSVCLVGSVLLPGFRIWRNPEAEVHQLLRAQVGLGLARPLRPPLANLPSLTAHMPCCRSGRRCG